MPMRALLGCLVLSASVALAQNVPGTWGGYVTGWTTSQPRSTFGFRDLTPSTRRPTLTERQRQYLVLQQLAAQQAFFATQNYVQLQQVSARQERQEEVRLQQLVAQQELAAEQRRQSREQELAAQQLLLTQQQQLAVQQQLLAQQQAQAAAEELARLAERDEKLARLEAAHQQQLEAEAARLALARAAADARPREKGPDIHRWVDEDGVVHYSTKPKR